MKKVLIIAVAIIVLLIGGVWLSKRLQNDDPDIISRGGIHWHPELEIFINGEKMEIPQNIGLGAIHMPMHTHEDLPIIHLEFPGMVRRGDIMLGQFFKNWGKDIRSFGPEMKMLVNGNENTDYENFIMHDGDKIELHYN